MTKRTHLTIGMTVTAALSAALAGPAAAGTIAVKDIVSKYNLVTSGDATTSSDIEGSTVVGGTFTGATVFNNNVPANPELYVFGKLGNTSSHTVNLTAHKSMAIYGPSGPNAINANQYSCNGTCALNNTLPTAPHAASDFTAPLNALSSQLEGLTANSTITTGTSKVNFNANANTDGFAVFNLTGAALQTDLANNSVVFNVGAGVKGIFVNVNGNFSQLGGTNWNPPVMQDVIFNFYNASTVSTGNWMSSILAPDASVGINSGGNINGFLYAKTYTGGGELHNYGYTGALPSAVPEPSTWAMLGLGFAGLGFAGVRRRRTPIAI